MRRYSQRWTAADTRIATAMFAPYILIALVLFARLVLG